MEDFEPQDFETFDQTVERLLDIERQLATRFGLMMLCVPTQGDPVELATQLAVHLQGGPLPPGAVYKPLEEIYAEGRIDDCTCGMISCVCKAVRAHKQDCRFRISLMCPVGIACEHGSDVCPICDACTCQEGHAEVRP